MENFFNVKNINKSDIVQLSTKVNRGDVVENNKIEQKYIAQEEKKFIQNSFQTIENKIELIESKITYLSQIMEEVLTHTKEHTHFVANQFNTNLTTIHEVQVGLAQKHNELTRHHTELIEKIEQVHVVDKKKYTTITILFFAILLLNIFTIISVIYYSIS